MLKKFIFMGPLHKRFNNTEWYTQQYFCCLNPKKKKKKNRQQYIRIRYIKFCSLKITLNTVKLTNLPQNTDTVPYSLKHCLFRQVRKLKKMKRICFRQMGTRQKQPTELSHEALRLKVYPPTVQFSFAEDPIADKKIRADLSEPVRRTIKPAACVNSSFQREKLAVHYNPNPR